MVGTAYPVKRDQIKATVKKWYHKKNVQIWCLCTKKVPIHALSYDINGKDRRFQAQGKICCRGHMINAPLVLTCKSVVLRVFVRITLIIAALNDLGV